MIIRRIAPILILFVLASCSSRQSLFVVLPNADGSSGAVTIETDQKSVLLDHPYAAGEVRKGVAAPVEQRKGFVQAILRSDTDLRIRNGNEWGVYPGEQHIERELLGGRRQQPACAAATTLP